MTRKNMLVHITLGWMVLSGSPGCVPQGATAPGPGPGLAAPPSTPRLPASPAGLRGQPGADLLIDNVRVPLADGTFSAPARVRIEGGRIASIDAADDAPGAASGASVDGGGGFLMPGLVDAHVHIAMPGVDRARLVAAGITGFIDLAADASVAGMFESGPGHLELVGPLYTATGGHGTEFKLDAVQVPPVATEEDVRSLVRSTARPPWPVTPRGIKIVYDDLAPPSEPGGPPPGGGKGFPVLSSQQLGWIIDEAVARGIQRVHVHIGGKESWTRDVVAAAVAAGQKNGPFYLVLEHSSGAGLDGPALTRLRAAGVEIAAVPTIVGVLFHIKEALTKQGVPEEQQVPILAGARAAMTQGVAGLAAKGVPIFVGTDTGVEGDFFKELACLAEAIGTSTGERATNLALLAAAAQPHRPRAPLVAEGHTADLIVVEADPLADLNALKRVRHAFVGGVAQGPAALTP